MIRGNKKAVMQLMTGTTKNAIGGREPLWEDVMELPGFLDYQAGEAGNTNFNAKIQETTHIFLCDYAGMVALGTEWLWNDLDFEFSFISEISGETIPITAENARVIVGGSRYDVLLIDDPMGLHKHLEIYLKYTGGQ